LGEYYSRENIDACVRDPEALFLVVEVESRLVGYAHLGSGAAGPEMFRLYVRPSFWRKGFGSSLIRELESELRKKGISEYRCRVHRDNVVGQAFYNRAGFVRNEEHDNEEGISLVRRLGSQATS